jgi:hypothetical protein
LSVSHFSRACCFLPKTPALLTVTIKCNLQKIKFVPLLASSLILEKWILGNPDTWECRSLPLKVLVSVMTRSCLRQVSLYMLRITFAFNKKEAGRAWRKLCNEKLVIACFIALGKQCDRS